ncbi:uncharacterized protein LOC116165305 [Photinus pyralis]|uniref:uncharacterized protein LOC116165305 n=1 Tax=Photinus pyralis TaxID=7054 RepID=UPI00126778BA|nr:uncharacterized protein LOC116165305 [Photinus pyralis]
MQQKMQTAFPEASTKHMSNVPWPKPLQVDEGDIYENFQLFKANWKVYVKATGMDQWSADREEQKVNILLSIIGDVAKVKFNNFSLTDDEKSNADEMLNTIGERCQFDKINPQELKKMMLRDRVAFGIRDDQLKKKFLRADPDKLTLDEVIQTCKVNEVTEDRFKNMNNEEKVVNKIKGAKNKDQTTFKHKCKKFVVIKENQLITKKHVKEIVEDEGEFEDASESDDAELTIHKITDNSARGGNVQAELTLKFNERWKTMNCELDTGANICVIGYENLLEACEGQLPELRESDTNLCVFRGGRMKVVGEVLVPCKRKEATYRICFKVVNYKHGPILSANACSKLGLIQFCNKLKVEVENSLQVEAENIINDYMDVFEGYDRFPGEVELEIDQNVNPVIQKARRIPISLRKKLKEELDKLVQEGILTREDQHTEWVSNILIVKKGTSFRICLDPIPLNKALLRPNYQFTTIDEVVPELGNAKVFSTVDATKGFWQLRLTEASSKLTTFWTPFGRFRWNVLPFGLNVSPEIFQMRLREMVQDLEGVEVMADDFSQII